MTQVVPDRRQRRLILGICSLSILIVGLDATVVNVALPSIHRSFPSPLSGLQWTIDAYTLVLASLLLLAGATGDRLGRRRVFQTGLALFTLGSLLCALAPRLSLLVVFRVVQAVGGAMMNPVAMSIVRTVFVDPRERARAIGVWGAMFGISMALGPVLGGLLVDAFSWRAIFLINLPVGVAAITLTARFVPESRAPQPRRIDPVGQVLVVLALGGLTFAVIEGGRDGFGTPVVVALLGCALTALAALVRYELHRPEPLLEIRFFSSAPFAGAIAIATITFAAIGGFLFLNTLYLQDARGLSPLHAGLSMLPMAATMVVSAPLTGRLVVRVGARPPLVLGGLAVAASGLMLSGLAADTPTTWLFSAYALFGLGSGLVNPPITNTAVSGMPPAQAGVASGIASAARQVGTTLGVAVLGAVAGAATGSIGRDFAVATHAGWWIVVALGLAVAALGWVTTTAWALHTALRTAERAAEREARTGRLETMTSRRASPRTAA